MLKRKRTLFFILPLILMMAACSSLKLPGTSANASAASQQTRTQNRQGQSFNMANQPVEQKLALGTLKLEGTDKAVTADEAQTLLPLWKAMKTLSSSSNTSTEEMNALYKQIEEAMTADQVQAIKDLSLNQTDLQALMHKYGIQASQPRGNFPTLSPLMQATMQARRSSGNGGAQAGGQGFGGRGSGGGFPGGGNMGGAGGNGGYFQGGGQGNAQRTPRSRGTGTPGAWQGNRGFRGGMNTLFVDPLIKLLQERAGVQPTPTVQ